MFQVKFFVTGGEDVFAEFIMFDQQIGLLIDTSASRMVKRMEREGDIDSIPSEFSKFIDKEMVVKLRVSREFNLQSRRSHCYTVSKFSIDKDMISKWIDKYNNNKGKGKEKVGVSISEDETGENDCATLEKSGVSDLIANDTTDYIGSPTTPSFYRTPPKRDSNDVDELCEISPLPDKESRNKTVQKYKTKKIK